MEVMSMGHGGLKLRMGWLVPRATAAAQHQSSACGTAPQDKSTPPPCNRLLLSHLLRHCVDTLLQVLNMLRVEGKRRSFCWFGLRAW